MFKPLLSPNEDPLKRPTFFKDIAKHLPLLCSFKLDGIRNITKAGACKSRTFKDLPNKEMQAYFSKYQELDSEMIDGCPHDADVYNRTQSTVMSADKPADRLAMYVFDYALESAANWAYVDRLKAASDYVAKMDDPRLILLEQTLCHTLEEVYAFEEKALAMGFEGIMMRSAKGRYKHGRATFNEGIIYKLKRFEDIEGILVSIEEKMTNNNEAFLDELGKTKRSQSMENKVGAGTAGRFLVKFDHGIENVGPGKLTHAQLQEIWDAQEQYMGSIFKVRHFPVGRKDKLRMGRVEGFRNKMDM